MPSEGNREHHEHHLKAEKLTAEERKARKRKRLQEELDKKLVNKFKRQKNGDKEPNIRQLVDKSGFVEMFETS